MSPTRILLAGALLASSAAFAGTAEVKFIDPDNFSDLATNRWEEPDTMNALANHIAHLAQRLPADQTLRVDVLDVDLAGTWRQTARGRLRTVSNRADPPKLHLRYALESHGQVLRSGEDRVTDLDYANRFEVHRTSSPLYYEKRVLDDWFARNFASQTQADAR